MIFQVDLRNRLQRIIWLLVQHRSLLKNTDVWILLYLSNSSFEVWDHVYLLLHNLLLLINILFFIHYYFRYLLFEAILVLVQLLSYSVKYGGQSIPVLVSLGSNRFYVRIHVNDLWLEFLFQLLCPFEIVKENTFLYFCRFLNGRDLMILVAVVEYAINT